MKAIVYTRYGPPEVLRLVEVPKPVPKDREVLIRIHATTVNRTDCGFRKPEYPVLIRPINGLFRPKKKILGSELAGVVEETGRGVTAFKPGEKVFGLSAKNFGAHAEYICLPGEGSIAAMPSGMSFEEAAAVCDGMMLATAYMRKIDFTNRPDILVNGASGSIGSAGVQLARYHGANVTAVCEGKDAALVKSLGAGEVFDYTKDDFTKIGRTFDVVFDAVGKSSFFRCRKLLKPGGTYFSTDLGFLSQNIFLSPLTPFPGMRKVRFPVPKDSREDILLFKKIIEEGKYRAVIDRRYPLERIVEATRYVETGRKTGNVVITLRHGE